MFKSGKWLLFWSCALIMLPSSLCAEVNEAATANNQFPSFANLVEKSLPSVVNISTTTKPSDEMLENEAAAMDEATPEFRRFFENGKKQEALGSGFIIDKEGYIITNSHVISDAEKINVTLFDDTQLEAKIIGKDTKTDIALIKIDTKKELTPVKLGDSDKIRVGDWILAIGNPFGLGGSVTAGIISAKSRDIESGQYDNFIQTDASINQGSSGGPMFNMQGEVIGINSVIFSTNGASMGIGFAIPINLADWVVKQLKKYGETKRGWIGIKIQPNNEEAAKELGLAINEGVIVSAVEVGAPAQKSGVIAGDVILEFDGQKINSTKNFSRLVAETEIAKKTLITVWRNRQKMNLPINVEKLEDETVVVENIPQTEIKEINKNEFFIAELGLKLSPADDMTLQNFKLKPESSGMVITEIMPKSDALEKGLKVGHIIVKIDKKEVIDIESVRRYINEAKMENNRPILLLLQDKEAPYFAALKLQTGKK